MPAAKPRKAATARPSRGKTAKAARTMRTKTAAARTKARAKRAKPAGLPVRTPLAPSTPAASPPASLAPSRIARPAPAFDPATGAWLPLSAPGPAGAPETGVAGTQGDAPDAPKKGPAYVLWTILLWIDLALLGLSVLWAIASGAVLLLAPESSAAESIREQLQGGSRSDLVVATLVSLVAFGLIPVLWLLGTRRDPIEGTKRFLHLHEPGKAVLRGVLLTIPLLIAVVVLVSLYTLATSGVEGLTNPDEGANPAVQEILDNLTWPLAVLIAVGAGVGEEIFFRGLLQRYLGVWGQAVLFGLAHSTGGYLPQILFALALGVAFGLLVKRGWSLWSLIVAHTLYDFTLLAMALVAPEWV